MVEDSYYRLNRVDCLYCNFEFYLSPKRTRNITVAPEIVRELFKHSWFRWIENTYVSKIRYENANGNGNVRKFIFLKLLHALLNLVLLANKNETRTRRYACTFIPDVSLLKNENSSLEGKTQVVFAFAFLFLKIYTFLSIWVNLLKSKVNK